MNICSSLNILKKITACFRSQEEKTDKKTSYFISVSNNTGSKTKNMTQEFQNLQNNPTKFISQLIKELGENVLEKQLLFEKIVDSGKFWKTLLKLAKTDLKIEIQMDNSLMEDYKTLFDFIQYIIHKTKILHNQKKHNLQKTKRLILMKEENSQNIFLKKFRKKILLLQKIRQFLIFYKIDLDDIQIFESLILMKRIKCFEDFSDDIFQFLLFIILNIHSNNENQLFLTEIINLIQSFFEENLYFINYLKNKIYCQEVVLKIQKENQFIKEIKNYLQSYLQTDNYESYDKQIFVLFTQIVNEDFHKIEFLSSDIQKLFTRNKKIKHQKQFKLKIGPLSTIQEVISNSDWTDNVSFKSPHVFKDKQNSLIQFKQLPLYRRQSIERKKSIQRNSVNFP